MKDKDKELLQIYVNNWLSTFPPYCDEETSDALFARSASASFIEMMANTNKQAVIDAINNARPEDLYLLGATW